MSGVVELTVAPGVWLSGGSSGMVASVRVEEQSNKDGVAA